MTVGAILNNMGHDVISERADTPLEDVCKVLAERGIGAILVTDAGGRIEGIISERDVVKTLAKKGVSALKQPVADTMTTSVVTCEEDATINDVMGLMTSGRFRHVPVVRAGKAVGLISIGDVVKHKIAQVELEAEQMRSYISMT